MKLLNGFKTLVNTLFFFDFVILEFSLSYAEKVKTDIILSQDISYLNFDLM